MSRRYGPILAELSNYRNQTVSTRLITPVTIIRRMRTQQQTWTAGAYDLIKRIIIKLNNAKKATIPVIAAIPLILASLKSFQLQAVLLV